MTDFSGLYFAVPDGMYSNRAHIFGLDDRSLCGRLMILVKDPNLCDPVLGTETFNAQLSPREGDCTACWRKAKHPNAPAKKVKS